MASQCRSATHALMLEPLEPRRLLSTLDVTAIPLNRAGIGSVRAAASAIGDDRAFSFVPNKSGDWTVALEPSGALDLNLTGSDRRGTVVSGGTLNAAGAGAAETWYGHNLKANSRYYIRAGVTNGSGTYTVLVERGNVPVVQLVSLRTIATEYRSRAAQVVVNRPAASDLTHPLVVRYSVGGAATNGIDYQPLSGVVAIPAGRTYARINVIPIADRLLEATESVVLTLIPQPAYIAASASSAVMDIIDNPINPDWPAAPFARGNATNIYVNQFGIATLPGQTVGAFSGYNLWFDDGGPLTLTATGSSPVDLAYYDDAGQPIIVSKNNGVSTSTSLSANVSPEKLVQYVGVRPHAPAGSSVYTLHVAGPPEGSNYPLDISPSTLAGSSGSDISGTYDYDIYRFKLPRNGNWLMQAIPTTSSLDVSMIVYDARGNPVAGSFTSAINNHGRGRTESWTGIGLKAGAVYYLRVDGVSNNTGGYGVSVQISP